MSLSESGTPRTPSPEQPREYPLPEDFPKPPQPPVPPAAPLDLSPPVQQVAIAENMTNVQMWKCSKGHISPAIGWLFSASLLGGDPNQGPLRDRRFCYVCLVDAMERMDVSEVERV